VLLLAMVVRARAVHHAAKWEEDEERKQVEEEEARCVDFFALKAFLFLYFFPSKHSRLLLLCELGRSEGYYNSPPRNPNLFPKKGFFFLVHNNGQILYAPSLGSLFRWQ
jgi:hypothetical protein